MTAQDLKNSILQLAVQGKLVKQDPNDEPASELLKRIRAEKQRLVKEGKIKKDKNPSEIFIGSDKLPYEKRGEETHCIDDEIPFDIPDSWAWCRLGEIANWGSGATPNRNDPEYYKNGTVPWLKTGDLNDGIISIIPELITPKAVKETSVKLNPVGSVLIAMYGATIGKLGILGIEATTNQACCAGIVHNGIFNKYLFYYLMSQRDAFKRRGEGSGQPNISKEKIIETIFPLPPLNEQKRIVEKIEELLPYVEEYGKCEIELTTLNKNFPDALKKSILQWAVQGKLVDQDPNDEPAIELLKRINPDFTPCDNGHYTFDVPSGWITTNLGSIFNVVSAKRILKSDWKHSGVPFYRAREIAKLSIYGLVDNELYISEEHYNSLKEKFPVPKASDIMISAVGTIGKCYIVKESDKFYYKDASVLCLCNDYQINAKYIYHIMRSEYMLKQMYDNSKGTTVDTITIEKAKQYILPLPPLAEQQRIVAKIEETFSIFDGIQNSLEA